ncbi:DUF2214 family protein [Mesorhizobium sp. CAU 1741]|uniref:DUF2214 family protein n=1 Tax=Mesorhizobium sp. CAU 1741 TaxID=3140366 RepID=UPI00325B172D
MASDLILASLHHVLVFSMFAIYAVEVAVLKPGLTGDGVARLARIDGVYGAVATGVIIVGIARVIWGLKGWEYYSGYGVFWAKMAAVALVGILSVPPTIRFRRWLAAAKTDPAYSVTREEIASLRPFLHGQGFVLLLIPVLAAMMARGVFY